MPGRKLNIIKRLGKEQNIFGSPKHVSKISAKAKFQKTIDLDINKKLEGAKITLNKALFAEKIKGIQKELSNSKTVSNFKKRQETRKSLIELINKSNKVMSELINKSNKVMRLPDSTTYSLGTLEKRFETLRNSNQYDRYLETLDKEYTKGLARLVEKGNNPEKITDIVNKVSVAITLHSEFLEKKLNFNKKAKSKEE